jgi:hypothetical protein
MSDREFLIEANIQDVLKYIIVDFGLSITEAMRKFYVSEVFAKLQNKDTGLYLESPAYIYDLYQNELKNGRLVQEEQ